MNWRSLARKWHINLGLFATVTLGLIAVSCFYMAPGQQRGDVGKALKEIHEGKFLPRDARWVWIYGQGGLLLWLILSGFLLHKKAKKVLNAESPDVPGTSALVLYGSESGNSEALAKRFGDRAEAAGFRAFVAPLDAYDTDLLKGERWLLVITSTYGEGEMPANAHKFWQSLSSSSMPKLPKLEFSVLALGDTNYEQFCAAGKAIDLRLEALEAKRIHPRVDCDTDYEAAADAWMQAVLEQLARGRKQRKVVAQATVAAPRAALEVRETPLATTPVPPPAAGISYSKKNPFPARMTENRRLTSEDFAKETRHYAIDFSGSGLRYETGDALGVMPTNCHDLVALTMSALGCDGEEGVSLRDGTQTSLRRALLHHCDITKPSRDFIKVIAERDALGELARLLEHGREADLKARLQGREVIDFLMEYPAPLSPNEFIALLRPLTPRLYSISSSSIVHPETAHLTVASVRYEAHGLPRRGVCSTFLADRVRGVSPVPVFVQPAKHFRLPQDSSRPVIMVGPGTGIAPFRAFLQEREATAASGKNWLFFGSQRSDADFLYNDEITTFQQRGTLHQLHTAFSRQGADKVYVQHRMQENASALWDWLQDGAHFYVCGDASRMAKDVDATLLQIAQSQGGLSPDNAADFLRNLKEAGRYQRDVY